MARKLRVSLAYPATCPPNPLISLKPRNKILSELFTT
jgi:hypothetical protein